MMTLGRLATMMRDMGTDRFAQRGQQPTQQPTNEPIRFGNGGWGGVIPRPSGMQQRPPMQYGGFIPRPSGEPQPYGDSLWAQLYRKRGNKYKQPRPMTLADLYSWRNPWQG